MWTGYVIFDGHLYVSAKEEDVRFGNSRETDYVKETFTFVGIFSNKLPNFYDWVL